MGCKADLKGAKIWNGSSNDDQVDDYRIRYSMFFLFYDYQMFEFDVFFYHTFISGFYAFALVEK